MRRALLTAAATLLVLTPTASAAPGDYTLTYDWDGAGDGFIGWGVQEVPAQGTPGFQTPYYVARLALPKLRIAPTPASDGTADRTYPFVEPPVAGPRLLTLVQAPGTTVIRSATFDDIDFLRTSNERQYLRLAVYGDPAFNDADNVYDFRTDSPPPGPFNNDVPYNNVGPITVDPSEPGGSAQVWLATSCDPSCPFVQFGPGGTPRSYGNVGKVTIDLFDPEAPSLTAAGELIAPGWTNSRDTRGVLIAAADPGSGVRNVTAVRRRVGGSSVTVLNQPAGCNATHTVQVGGFGRESAACPDGENTGFTQPLGALPDGEYTYSVTATDDSTRATTNDYTVRLDRTRPGTVTGTGPLRALMSRWTNRTDKVSLLVRGRDTRSGIQRVEVVAQLDGGVERVVGASDLACGVSCPQTYAANLFTDLSALPDGRVSIFVRATDAAGNVNQQRVGTLLLDRVAPPAPSASVQSSGSGTTLSVSPQADPAPGSGVGGFEATTQGRSFRSSGRRARLPFKTGVVDVRSFDRAGNTGTAFAAGYGLTSCREALEGAAFTKPAKIGEVRAGRDTTGTLTYGEGGDKTLELVGSFNVKGVGIGLSESYTRSVGIEVAKTAIAGSGYNVFVNLNMKAERLQRFENGKRKGYCKRTVGPKKVYRVIETSAKPMSALRMPSWQRGRADCNNNGRWTDSHRINIDPDSTYTKNQNNKITYKRGLTVLGIGFSTANTWSRSSAITYKTGHKYKRYWLCGDGGGKDSRGIPDFRTWTNLFAGADTTR